MHNINISLNWITADLIVEFQKQLSNFHKESSSLYGIQRFICMLDFMFSVFGNKCTTPNPYPDLREGKFSMYGNFDTGDAHGLPFSGFSDELRRILHNEDEYRKYYGPQVENDIKISIKKFLAERGVVEENVVENLGFSIGAGTVNLYDVICRKIIKRKGDVIILPVPTYGFFIPQIFRSFGQPLYIFTKKGEVIDFNKLEKTIEQKNLNLLELWKANIESEINTYLVYLCSVINIRVKKPSQKLYSELIKRIRILNDNSKIDDEIFQFLSHLIDDKHTLHLIMKSEEFTLPTPPRIVGFLHINPTIYGSVISKEDTREYASILKKYHITMIEDLAYFGIETTPNVQLQSCVGENLCDSIGLFGLSKPFGIAGLRLGVAFSDPLTMKDIDRRIENEIGFISPMFHKVLSSIFLAPKKDIDDYLFKKNLDSDEGYLLKKQLMIFCFEGDESKKLSESVKIACKEICKKYISEYLSYRIKNESISLILNDHNQAKCVEDILLNFVSKGISEWFEITHNPVAGFFIIADCSKLMNASFLGEVHLNSSFDVFAFLAYFFGVRFIPAESMGIENKADCSLLRVSFSCDIQFIVVGLFSLFLGINHFICNSYEDLLLKGGS